MEKVRMGVLGYIGWVLLFWGIVTFFLGLFQYVTEIMLINPGYFQFIIIFGDTDITPWIIGFIGVALFIFDRNKKRTALAHKNLVLGNNETLIKDAAGQIASSTSNGHLFLTNQRIKYDGFEYLDDKGELVEGNDYDFEILIKDIASVKEHREGGMETLTITAKNGEKYILSSIYKTKSWVEDIEKLLGNSVGIE